MRFIADYTIGFAIVLTHLVMISLRSERHDRSLQAAH
jgi:hypothetical protein